jgi:phytanoyl-CoA hydroxylase
MTTPRVDAHRPVEFTFEQVSFFRENGYVAGPRVLTDDQIERLRRRIDDLVEGRVPFPALLMGEASDKLRHNLPSFKIVNLFRHDPVFAQVYASPAISTLAHGLLEGPVRLWEDQMILKKRFVKDAPLAWHQDYPYWDHVGPPDLLTCWIALDDATTANGCMHVVPRSHRWGAGYRREEVDVNDPRWLLDRGLAPPGERIEEVPCEVPAGHCHFHHCLTFHGSYGNTTDNPRRSYILHLMPGYTRRIGEPWNPRQAPMHGVRVGDVVRGPDYPELPPPVRAAKEE